MGNPIYMDVAKAIEQKINSGEYKIKERLPSERNLAITYGVSRMTARQAVQTLQDRGLVYREVGSGTFVQAPSIEQNNVKSFTETVGAMGYSVNTKVLEFSTIHSIEKVSKELELPADTSYYKIKRLRLGNGIPMALEILYVPIDYCPNLGDYDMTESFYSLLETEYDVTVSRVSLKMEAIIANPIHSKIMELKKSTALLRISGVTYDNMGRKLLYEESLYRSDLYNYHVDINRKF